MTPHVPSKASVERCARAISGLQTLDEWTREQVAREVLRCAAERCGYWDPDTAVDYGLKAEGECLELRKERDRLRGALELIAMPARSDGTYNRCREACEKIARDALEGKT